jgi:hypothetical protein
VAEVHASASTAPVICLTFLITPPPQRELRITRAHDFTVPLRGNTETVQARLVWMQRRLRAALVREGQLSDAR